MPGIASDASCPCGYSDCVRHGVSEALNWEPIVVAYDPENLKVVSLGLTEVTARKWDYIQEYPDGSGYRCPACGNTTLTFRATGFHWD